MRKCIFTVAVLFCSLAGHALGVTVAPGELAAAVGAATDSEELIIEGYLDSSDFLFIEKSMPGLSRLDLSSATFDAIPDAVFAGSALKSVVLPSGCRVGCLAFSGSALETVELPAGSCIGDGAFAACRQLKSVVVKGEVALGRNAFCDNSYLAAVEGGTHITAIGDRAFDGCTALEKFDFSPSLQSLGYRAFAGTGLTEANLGACVLLDSIGAWTFAGCASLHSATLPPHHGKGVFFGCNALENIDIAAGEIADFALTNTAAIKKLVFPSHFCYAGHSSMEGMKALQEIDGSALETVPSLGSDVWARTEQEKVTLKVVPSLADAFASAPQWSSFNIVAEATGVPLLVEGNGIKVWFAGNDLMAESAGSDVHTIAVTDVEGRSRMRVKAASQRACIDASALAANVYIVEITLADGSRHVAKVKKNG